MTHWLGLFICLTWFFLPGLAACWNPKDEALDEAKQEELAKQEKLSERYLAHMMNTDPNRQLDDTLREQRELRPLPSGVPQFTVVLDNPPWRVVRFPEFSTAKSMASNAYGIMNTDKHQAVLVDAPALSVPAIETWLYNEDLTLTAILLTHGHFDHASGLDALKAEHPKAKSYLGKEDVPLLAELPKQAYEFGLVSEAAAGVDDAIDGEPTLDLGYLELKTIAVPGHTPGQRVFLLVRGEPAILRRYCFHNQYRKNGFSPFRHHDGFHRRHRSDGRSTSGKHRASSRTRQPDHACGGATVEPLPSRAASGDGRRNEEGRGGKRGSVIGRLRLSHRECR